VLPLSHAILQARETREPVNLRVFVVDDERSIADTLAAIFRMNGYEATAFYNAEDALAACADGCPDFVFTDVQMPRIDGVSLAVQIQARFPECRIVLITAYAAPEELLARARKRGYEFELLNKPVHPVHLLARLLAAAA
jgi:CheY-like chemotaxis protein